MKILVLLFFSFFMVLSSPAQEKEDIKVGLVLSGGGAKGLAHIGVLKVIEEAGVRIDYIGGTSMGAIVGGLYASGYTAKDLDSIFKNIDFETLIQDNIPRSAKTFYEKHNYEKYAITLPFNNFKISFPASLSKGQNLYNLLYKLTDHVSEVNDFSNLPTPFFCMATNVETGKQVKLDSGNLALSIAASAALPSLFSPVEVNGNLLLDGGITNNYPVDEVRKMGADIIIGVDVQDTLISRENLKSALDLLVQINNYRTIHDMVQKRKKTDIYIHPVIKDFSVISFEKGEQIIKSGKDKAQLFEVQLRSLAGRQQAVERKIIRLPVADTINISNVVISGNQNYTRAYILGKLKLQPPVTMTFDKFNEGINNLTATGNFNQLSYDFKDTGTSSKILEIEVHESAIKNLLRLGVHYDDLYKSAALINFTSKRLLQKNDVASLDIILGDNVRYNFDYYIDKGYYWSFGLTSRYNRLRKNVNFELFPLQTDINNGSVAKIEIEHQDFTNQIYVQTLFQQIYSLGLGLEHKYLNLKSSTFQILESGEREVEFENRSLYSAYGILKLDSRDSKYFSKNGVFFEGQFNFYVFASPSDDFESFSIAKATAGYSFTPLDKFSVLISAGGGFKIGGRQTKSLDFFLGGYGYEPINNFVHFFGYDAMDIRGDTYLKSSVRMSYEIFKKNYITATANIANAGDRLFTSSEWIDSIDHRGYALGYGLDTFVGPIELFYSYSPERAQSEWYVSLGFWF